MRNWQKPSKLKFSKKLNYRLGKSPVAKWKIFSLLFLPCLLVVGFYQTQHKTEAKPLILGAYQTTQNYTTKEGDTIFKIAEEFGVDWKTIVEANDLKAPFDLHPGQTLQVYP